MTGRTASGRGPTTRDRIGHIIFERLAPRAEKSEAPAEHEIVIDPEFMLRDSTGPAAE